GPWTVFAPSNAAIAALPSQATNELRDDPSLFGHAPFLRRLVAYHIVPRLVLGSDFRSGEHLPTLQHGYPLMLTQYESESTNSTWLASGSIIETTDLLGNNGVVHVLSRLMYAPYGSVAATITLSPLLSAFVALVEEDTEVLAIINGPNPTSVFAPSNEALMNVTIPIDGNQRQGNVEINGSRMSYPDI
ncbi:unnamed protein product, partial [Meganyctiphanes norvegica]